MLEGVSVKMIIWEKKGFFHFRYGMQFFMDSLYRFANSVKKSAKHTKKIQQIYFSAILWLKSTEKRCEDKWDGPSRGG